MALGRWSSRWLALPLVLVAAGADAPPPASPPPLRPGAARVAVAAALQSPARTVLDPTARRRPITVVECLALALGNAQAGPPGTTVSLTTDPPGVQVCVPAAGLSPAARAELLEHAQALALEAERAYWDLYRAVAVLEARETALRLAGVQLEAARERQRANQLTTQDLAQVEEQYHLLEGQRLRALGSGTGRPGVLEAERVLRRLVGLPAEDGCALVPAEAPPTAPPLVCWADDLRTALAVRPDLLQARAEASAEPGGAARLLRRLCCCREEPPAVSVCDREAAAVSELLRATRQAVEAYQLTGVARARREAAERHLAGRRAEFEAGVGRVDLLSQAQQAWADAAGEEATAWADYAAALADLERQKGTLLRWRGVCVRAGR
jgi:hypothetical protein